MILFCFECNANRLPVLIKGVASCPDCEKPFKVEFKKLEEDKKDE